MRVFYRLWFCCGHGALGHGQGVSESRVLVARGYLSVEQANKEAEASNVKYLWQYLQPHV